jgi:hypothetical protein
MKAGAAAQARQKQPDNTLPATASDLRPAPMYPLRRAIDSYFFVPRQFAIRARAVRGRLAA